MRRSGDLIYPSLSCLKSMGCSRRISPSLSCLISPSLISKPTMLSGTTTKAEMKRMDPCAPVSVHAHGRNIKLELTGIRKTGLGETRSLAACSWKRYKVGVVVPFPSSPPPPAPLPLFPSEGPVHRAYTFYTSTIGWAVGDRKLRLRCIEADKQYLCTMRPPTYNIYRR